jgi:hypothetical protein
MTIGTDFAKQHMGRGMLNVDARLTDFETRLLGVEAGRMPELALRTFVATEGQTTFNLTDTIDLERMKLEVEGIEQTLNVNYTVTLPSTIILNEGVSAGTNVSVWLYGTTNQTVSSQPFIKKGELYINVNDYKDWVVAGDWAPAITRAENDAYILNTNARLYIPYGTYQINSKVTIRCELDASQATFEYYGTGTALVIGDDSVTGIVTYRKNFFLPRVINKSRGTTGWDGTSIGVKCVNLNDCKVFVSFIQDFEKGLNVTGLSQGTAYSNFYLGSMWDNHKNIVLDGDATGWVNQNTFIGGRLQLSLSKGAVVDDMNAVMIDMSSTIQPNNNTFIGTSLEGINVAYYRLDISGRFNTFYNCRFEAQSGSTPRVRYRASAYSNVIDGGYDASKIVETFDAGSLGGGEIRDLIGAYTSAFNTSGQSIPNNVLTDINSWNTPVGRRISYNAATGEFTPRAGRWKITATICFTTSNATGRRYALLTCNGSSRDFFEVPATINRSSMKVEDVYRFDGTQTFKFSVYQSSGAALPLETTSGFVKMQAEYLGN